MSSGQDTFSALVGKVVADRYLLESVLGVGALGTVFRARHVLIDRAVAIKLLHLEPQRREHYRDWFLREARAVNRVNHANIAEIYDFGETRDGLVYLVMELLDGPRLADLVAAGPLDQALCVAVAEQVAAALARAHDLGVVHRDLKPEHVFLVEHGGRHDFVKLVDFGLAHLEHEGQLSPRGALLGTPAYISPEVANGQPAGPQADLYALGVILFEMLTGSLPFPSSNMEEFLERHRSQPPPDPAGLRPGLDPGLAALTLRLLDKDLCRRYRDGHHLGDDCRALAARLGPPPSGVIELPVPSLAAPAPAALSSVTGWALKAAALARMAAAAYPEGGAPQGVPGGVDELWAAVALLARLDGELQVLGHWDENLRQRAREATAQLGREIEAVSRLASRLRRETEEAADERQRLAIEQQQAEEDVISARAEADRADASGDGATLRRSLETAGSAAARQQGCVGAIARLDADDARREQAAHLAALRMRRLREQLGRASARAEDDLAAGRARSGALLARREEVLQSLRRLEGLLRSHFSRRSECRKFMEELDRL